MDKKIAIFGDSISYGVWDTVGGGWFSRLRKYYEMKSQEHQFYNFSICGYTSDDLVKVVKFETSLKKLDIAFVAIGINDAGFIENKNKPWVSQKRFEKNIQKIHQILKVNVKKIIFVGLTKVNEKKTDPIVYSRLHFYYNDRIKQYNDLINEYCIINKLDFIDVYSEFKIKYINNDGLHPNSLGQKYIFEKVKLYLLKNKIL